MHARVQFNGVFLVTTHVSLCFKK